MDATERLPGVRRIFARQLAVALGLHAQPTPVPVPTDGITLTADATLDDAMRQYIEERLARHEGRIEGPTGVAAALGIHPNTLRSRMQKLGVRR